jgi:cytochrome P450
MDDDGAADGSSLISLMDEKTAANPQPLFKELRDTMPVIPIAGLGVMVTRKAEADEVFRHPEVFSSNADAVDLKNIRPLIPLQIDPPEHKKYRKLLDPIFAPRQMALIEESVARTVNGLIDGFIDRGEVDFAGEFAVPFPSEVFLDLLGLSFDELPRFLAMKDGIIRPHLVVGAEFGSQEAQDHQQLTADSIYEYFNEILDRRELKREDDLLSRFLDAEVDGNRLTREDILDICFLFLIAGLDTVTATLDCMFAYLVQHPEQRQRIVDDESVIPAAIEELLRWETPVQIVARVAMEDTEVAGCPVHKGENVMVLIGSVNTDEGDLPDAHDVRFDREVNKHSAFGAGVHRCLGSHLARQELRVALREWHRRIPEYSVPEGHTLVYTPAIRSIDHFPLVFTAAAT